MQTCVAEPLFSCFIPLDYNTKRVMCLRNLCLISYNSNLLLTYCICISINIYMYKQYKHLITCLEHKVIQAGKRT